MWSDPDVEIMGFTGSGRGAGYMFVKDVVAKFIVRNRIKNILRAHPLCMEGFQIVFETNFATLWSA